MWCVDSGLQQQQEINVFTYFVLFSFFFQGVATFCSRQPSRRRRRRRRLVSARVGSGSKDGRVVGQPRMIAVVLLVVGLTRFVESPYSV